MVSLMRRLVPTAVLTAALLGAGVAPATAAKPRTGTFKAAKGDIQLGTQMQFTVDRGGKRIRKVAAFVLENCTNQSWSTWTMVGPKLSWTVDGKGRFKGRKKETSGALTLYTTLEGRFTSPTVAKGTIRQESVILGTRCETGRLRFTVKRR
jgi:hypothetical protein